MPYEPMLDVVRRTMENLRFVEAHKNEEGTYEVTQLINSFLGVVCHPWDQLRDDFKRVQIGLDWPQFVSAQPSLAVATDLYDLVRKVRNAFAHGNLVFLSQQGEVSALRIQNKIQQYPLPSRVVWDVTISVADLHRFLDKFAAFVESLPERYQAKHVA